MVTWNLDGPHRRGSARNLASGAWVNMKRALFTVGLTLVACSKPAEVKAPETMTTDGNPKIRPRITTVLLVAQELSLDGCPAFHGAESAQ